MLLLYNLALIDAIILPLSVAVLASRSCELEHKGGTWKLLETMANPGKLYAAKLVWGALVLAALLVVRTGIFAAMGMALHFPGTVPWVRFGVFTLISWGGVHDGLRFAAGAVFVLRQPGGGLGMRGRGQLSGDLVHALSAGPGPLCALGAITG